LRPRDARQAELIALWLDELARRFSPRILPVDTRVAEEWGRLSAKADRGAVDCLIAATARVHELTVVTRNTADFEDYEVALLDPWGWEAR
jgi:predicted nucleic acid-binding protein